MAGFDRGPEQSQKPESAGTSARNARVGLIFFAIYLAVYCGYVALAAFARSVMDATPVAGLNVATLYGLGLIVLAFLLALAYGWACRVPANSPPSATDGSPSTPPGRDA